MARALAYGNLHAVLALLRLRTLVLRAMPLALAREWLALRWSLGGGCEVGQVWRRAGGRRGGWAAVEMLCREVG